MRMFSVFRMWAILTNEFIHMMRDRLTFGMIVGIPVIQIVLFGFAINLNPKNLPTDLISHDHSQFTRTFLTDLQNTDYFRIKKLTNEKTAKDDMDRADASFVLNIPANFSRQLVRNEHPQMLLTVDASDPGASGSAVAAATYLAEHAFNHDFRGPLADNSYHAPPVNLVVHEKFNPEEITSYTIVPGLMGVILTMTLVMITGLAITREYEIGTMETLLATPLRPIEVMLGKVFPYLIVAYIQMILVIIAMKIIFFIPIAGSIWTLLITSLPFVIANLSVGVMFSTIARNQLQAIQMTFFFFLPSILLSGFMFPFYGMPVWAQWLGEIFPLTHYVVMVRGIILKGTGWAQVWPTWWPILIFLGVVLGIGLLRYRQQLD